MNTINPNFNVRGHKSIEIFKGYLKTTNNFVILAKTDIPELVNISYDYSIGLGQNNQHNINQRFINEPNFNVDKYYYECYHIHIFI